MKMGLWDLEECLGSKWHLSRRVTADLLVLQEGLDVPARGCRIGWSCLCSFSDQCTLTKLGLATAAWTWKYCQAELSVHGYYSFLCCFVMQWIWNSILASFCWSNLCFTVLFHIHIIWPVLIFLQLWGQPGCRLIIYMIPVVPASLDFSHLSQHIHLWVPAGIPTRFLE